MRKSALCWFGLVVTALVALGLIVLSSASEANAIRLHHGDSLFFLKRQFIYLAIALVLGLFAAVFDYHRWRDYPILAWLLYIAVIALLAGVFYFKEINGSHRWIILGPVRLQPSELAKITIVIVLAVWLDRLNWHVEQFKAGALLPAVFIGIIALPILREPDFGSVMVIGLVGFLVMFVAGVRILHMLPFIILGSGVVAYKVLTNTNRVQRLFDENKLYQVKMALAAIGNANIWGAGFGESMQKHLYLPEAHTDFVFAVGAEELGIIFSVGVMLLFIAFFALSIYIARNASDRFGRFLVIGMGFIIFFQAVFNMGVVCKALPTKGMALPFFSYGGTNLISSFIAVGIIFSVGLHSYRSKQSFLGRKVLSRSKNNG